MSLSHLLARAIFLPSPPIQNRSGSFMVVMDDRPRYWPLAAAGPRGTAGGRRLSAPRCVPACAVCDCVLFKVCPLTPDSGATASRVNDFPTPPCDRGHKGCVPQGKGKDFPFSPPYLFLSSHRRTLPPSTGSWPCLFVTILQFSSVALVHFSDQN